jgi:hypothetical protein
MTDDFAIDSGRAADAKATTDAMYVSMYWEFSTATGNILDKSKSPNIVFGDVGILKRHEYRVLCKFSKRTLRHVGGAGEYMY